jgi:hypothetical protein
MKTIILIVSIALVFLATSCSTAPISPGYYLAKENEEIDLSLRQEIHKLNDNIIEVIQKGNSDELLGYFAIGLLGEQDLRQQIINNFTEMTGLTVEKEFEQYQDYHCIWGGGGNMPCIILPKTDYDFQISIQRVSDEMFLSLLNTQEFNQLLLSIIYVKQDNNWKVYLVNIGSFKIAEKNAVQWYEEALPYYNQGYLISAGFRLGMAKSCLHPAPFLKYQKEDKIVELIEKDQAEINSKYSFPIQLSHIESNPVIYSIKPQFVQQDIIPVVWYITSIKLEDINNLKEEANLMSPIVQQMFPGIAEGTKYIVFKAFSELPNDPKKTYTSYGTVVEVN